jgi:hypothetical protein
VEVNDPRQALQSGKLTMMFLAVLAGLSLVTATAMPDTVHAATVDRTKSA